MANGRSHPFTNFILAQAHSGQTLAEFVAGYTDEELRDNWGLNDDQITALREGDLAGIQQFIYGEFPEESPMISFWIGNIPWPWIGS